MTRCFSCLRNQDVQLACTGLALSGASFAAIVPYQGIVAIDVLKFTNAQYSMLALAGAVTSVIIAI